MRVNKQQFLLAVRGSGGWIDKTNGKVIHKGLAGMGNYCYMNDFGKFEVLEKNCINDDGFIRIPQICIGAAEIAFLQDFQEELAEVIDSYGLNHYLNAEYPVFYSDSIDDAMIEYGMEAFSKILLMIEEKEFAADLYERPKIEIRMLEEWLKENNVELLEDE